MFQEDLKVLLISPLPPPAGGIASWTTQYVSWSEKNNLRVEIVNTAVIGTRAERINSKTNLLDEIIRTFRILRELKYKIGKFNPDVVHLNTPCGKLGIVRDYMCAKISKRMDKKLFVHYRCNISDQVGHSSFIMFFLKRIVKIANVNLVLNDSSKEFLEKIITSNCIKIANFIDEKYIPTSPKVIPEHITLISFIGHIQKSKGIFQIISAAQKFPEITFKLAGPVSDEIRETDIPSNLYFLGSLAKNEVKDLLSESDAFLFPSYTEGFSNAMLEAMAVGLPIIATCVGANEDMIENHGGVVIEVGDFESIVTAIKYIENRNIREKMSSWNIDKVKSEYTTDKIMTKLISLYSSEIDKK